MLLVLKCYLSEYHSACISNRSKYPILVPTPLCSLHGYTSCSGTSHVLRGTIGTGRFEGLPNMYYFIYL